MNTENVANRLVSLCREGKNMEAVQELYDANCISREMKGFPNEITEGFENIMKKNEQWLNNVEEFHNGEVSDPVVVGNHFSCKMAFDVTFKDSGRQQMEELCMYKVNNGKIVEEQFFYEMPN